MDPRRRPRGGQMVGSSLKAQSRIDANLLRIIANGTSRRPCGGQMVGSSLKAQSRIDANLARISANPFWWLSKKVPPGRDHPVELCLAAEVENEAEHEFRHRRLVEEPALCEPWTLPPASAMIHRHMAVDEVPFAIIRAKFASIRDCAFRDEPTIRPPRGRRPGFIRDNSRQIRVNSRLCFSRRTNH